MTKDGLPWLRYYGAVPPTLRYPEGSLSAAVLATASRGPDAPALTFLGATTTYRQLAEAIERCAAALAGLGLRAGDRITIALPTSPQGVIAFYAANRLGAVAVMVHPLCTPPEIEFYLNASRSRFALTLDLCYPKFAAVRANTGLEQLIVTRITDTLGPLKRLAYRLTRGRTAPTIPRDQAVRWWRPLMALAWPAAPQPEGTAEDLAAILFSGGTTGSPKGVMLSNRNLTAEGMQAAVWVGLGPGDVMLAALPIFHGVGLGLCINAVLLSGGKAILVPVFNAAAVADVIRTGRPTLMVGVPTLYDALTRDRSLARADLSCLRAAFSGADTLPRPVKERFERMVAEHGGAVQLVEGYGLTEAVTGIMAMPLTEYREGSVGVPFSDMRVAICRPGTVEELPAGAEGEICVAGPCVMLGYLDDPAATAEVLRRHGDGRLWLHTGDLGQRDQDGFFYFTVRLKRMIKSSGFNVYPAQVEAVLYRHPAVAEACVIGVPDPSQGERVLACVVLRDGVETGAEWGKGGAGTALERELIDFCRQQLIKWSCPRAVEFRTELPKTRLGKVDYRALASEHGR
jgi:long-chain acyl-CoA synthetase